MTTKDDKDFVNVNGRLYPRDVFAKSMTVLKNKDGTVPMRVPGQAGLIHMPEGSVEFDMQRRVVSITQEGRDYLKKQGVELTDAKPVHISMSSRGPKPDDIDSE